MISNPNFDLYVSQLSGHEVKHLPADLGPLPAYIRERYELEPIEIAGQTVGAIHLRKSEQFSPALFRQHLRGLPSEFQRSYVVIAPQLPSYVRNRMVMHGIPFVVPGVQIHWPQLGIAARRRASRGLPLASSDGMLPAAQAVLISASLGQMREHMTAREVARKFGYTPMTMTRVFNDLEANRLASTKRYGHERYLIFRNNGRNLWEHAKLKLRSPIRRILRVQRSDVLLSSAILAGESALSQSSMLEAPQESVYAIGPRAWRALREADIHELPQGEALACQLQIWRYDPRIIAGGSKVDPLSLFLSLQDVDDERVNAALEEMMEKISW